MLLLLYFALFLMNVDSLMIHQNRNMLTNNIDRNRYNPFSRKYFEKLATMQKNNTNNNNDNNDNNIRFFDIYSLASAATT